MVSKTGWSSIVGLRSWSVSASGSTHWPIAFVFLRKGVSRCNCAWKRLWPTSFCTVYQGEPGHPIAIMTFVAAGTLSISVDDQAPPFSPIDFLPTSSNGETKSVESTTPGGNGIRLLRRFSGSLHYKRLRGGNRLTIAFPLTSEASRV